ncbi:MAG: tRNA (guanosine(37)-N1)-methyltransferase TrmD [Lachnospiraceae bacterium]|jgi:tRNA (guanine37-N1)-methyltransferase|nr:tRNA (guanosine(37)-N1)-methyltransferase TrmD [Lachnospiraceae bacterium]
MNFYVLTLFPEAIAGGLNHSIIKRAISNNIISINCVDIRDFSGDKHNRVDDYPYGGGAGMVIRAAPVYDAYNAIKKKVSEGTRLVYMTPQGKPFNQKTAEEFSKEKDIIILCGHYEGIDERVIETIVTDEISMGDFVLSGGEIPAMAFIDSVSRLIPGVLGKEESFLNESFSDNLLEHPQYTRPRIFMDRPVPEVLLSGNHKEIEKWRHEQSLRRTKEKRPDLLK